MTTPSNSVLCLALYSSQRHKTLSWNRLWPHHRTVYCVWHCTVFNDTRHCHKLWRHHRTVYCVCYCTVVNDTRHCHKTGSDVTIGQCIASGTVQLSTTQDTVIKQILTSPSDIVLCLALYSFQRHHRTVYCVWHCTVFNDTRHCPTVKSKSVCFHDNRYGLSHCRTTEPARGLNGLSQNSVIWSVKYWNTGLPCSRILSA